jgi:hypothetical protein
MATDLYFQADVGNIVACMECSGQGVKNDDELALVGAPVPLD